MADVIITVGAETDQASVDAAAAAAGADYGKTFGSASAKALKSSSILFKDLKAVSDRAKGLLENATKTGIDIRQFAPLQRALERLLALQRQFAADRERLARDPAFLKLLKEETVAVQALSSSQTRELQSFVAASNVQERRISAELEKNLSLRNIQAQRDAQLQINAERTKGKARIVLAQQVGAQLLSIERITSNAITNLIRGAAKTVGKIWDSTVGSLRRTFSERRTIVEGGLRNETRLFTQSAIISQRANQGILGLINNNLGTIGGGFAIGAAARQIFTLGSDFARGLNVLQAQLQLTDKQMEAVQKQSIQLGNDISLPGVSALDAANAINLLAKQFANLGPAALGAAQDAAKGTLQLARAVGAPAEEAAQTVGAAVNVFGEDARNATRVADQLTAALSQAAGTSFSDFSLAFTQGAAVVNSFIGPADGATNAITEFSAAIAVLARGGLVGSDAGTSIKQFFLQANRGTDETIGALKEISERAGVTGTAFFTEEGQARSLVETVSILQKGLAGLSEEQRANTIQTLFGSDAARVANILIGQGAAELLKAEAATQRQGAAADLAAAQNKGLAGAIDAIKSQFETFAILIFQKVNPILGKIGLGIAGFIDQVANGEGAFATFRKGVLGVAAAFGTLLAIRGITEVAGLIGSIVSALGPFGLAVAGLGAIIGIATGGFRNFGDTFKRLGELVRTASQLIKQGLQVASAFLARVFAPAIERVTDAIRPFTSRAGAFIQRLIDIGRAFKQAFTSGGFAFAIQNLRRNLASLAQDIGTVLAPVGKAIVDKLINVRDFALGIRDKIVVAFRSIDFGALFSSIGRTVSGVLSTSLGRGLAGGGIGAGIGALVAGPLGAAIGAALGAAIALAIPKLKQAISRINVADLFGGLLNKIHDLGRLIGQILSSRQFLTGVAGIAAAAVAIGVQFVTGFVQGVLSHLGDIAAVGATILNTLFSQGSIVKSLAALAIVVAQFRSILKRNFVPAAKAIGEEGGKAIADGTVEGVQKAGLGTRIKAALTPIGKAVTDAGKNIAAGLANTLAAGLSGSALGQASNPTEGILGLAGLASSTATAFALGGGPTPAGFGLAAGTLGVGLLTAALSHNAKQAAEAKARMLEYKDAVDQAAQAGKDAAPAIEDVFGTKLKGASDSVLRGLQDAGLNLQGLQDAAGRGDLDAFIDQLSSSFRTLNNQANDLRNKGLIGDADKIQREADDINSALKFVRQQQKAIADQASRTDLEKSLDVRGLQLGNLTQFATKVHEIATNAVEAARQKKKLAEELRTERVQASLEVIRSGTEAIGKAADVSKQKILELAQGPQAKTPEQGGAEAVQGVVDLAPDVSQSFLTGLDTALGSAQLTNALSRLNPILSTAVQDGLGNAFTPEQITRNLEQIKAAVNQATTPDGQPISQDVKDALLKGIADFEAVNVPQIIDVQAVADLRTAALAGDQVASAALASRGLSSPISIKSKADAVAAGLAGEGIFTTADTFVQRQDILVASKANTEAAASAGTTIHDTAQKNADKQITVGSKVTADTSAAKSAGTQIVRGLESGIASAIGFVTKAITAVTNGVTQTAQVNFKIKSPSRVFMGIGEDVVKGLALGLTESTERAVQAAEDVATAVIEATQSTAARLAAAGRAATGGIFSGVFDSAAQQARRAGFNAGIAVTQALEGIRDSVDQQAAELWQAAMKPAAERTGADIRTIAASDFSSAFNLSNQQAIATAVDAIKDFGKSLIDQGVSAQGAADSMLAYRNSLIAASVAAGLNAEQVSAIVDNLGLSNAALQEFIRLSNQATAIVGAAPSFNQTPPPLTPGPNAAQTFIINNEFATPFDDPQAVSLAVVNRLAQSVRR